MKSINYKYTNTGFYPIRYIKRGRNAEKNINSLENLNVGFKTKGVSNYTQKKIRLYATMLSYLSTPKQILNTKNKIVNHTITFITLTLPSKQEHKDTIITKEILQHFLNRCRKLKLLENYVWRAEKQKNGNIHYHILTDSYAPYTTFYKIWLVSCNRLNYCNKYKEKFENMTLQEYSKQQFNKNKTPTKILDTFLKNKRNNWAKPPCIQTDYLENPDTLTFYISKYIGKNSKENDNTNIVEGRTWAVSTNLRKATEIFKTDKEFNQFWFDIGQQMFRRETIEFDFFEINLFNLNSLKAFYPESYEHILQRCFEHFQPCLYYLKYTPRATLFTS